MNKHAFLVVLAAAAITLNGTAFCKGDSAGQDSDLLEVKPENIEAGKDMRFGMSICWGPVSLTGHEIGWSRGKQTPIDRCEWQLGRGKKKRDSDGPLGCQ